MVLRSPSPLPPPPLPPPINPNPHLTPPPPPHPHRSHFGTRAGGCRCSSRTPLVHPFVQAAPAGVHEEVADGGEFQSQLLRNGYLHLFGRTLVLLEDGVEGPSLDVGKHQPRLLGVATITAVVAAAVVSAAAATAAATVTTNFTVAMVLLLALTR